MQEGYQKIPLSVVYSSATSFTCKNKIPQKYPVKIN